jgi:hypothetical protein
MVLLENLVRLKNIQRQIFKVPVPAGTISDFKFVAGGKQTSADDMLFLIDYYVSFTFWGT